jgi:hypothetical protein
MLKIKALIVAVIFCLQQIAFFAPPAVASISGVIASEEFVIASKAKQSLNPNFKLPFSIGFIEDSFKGDENTVILIQDAHTNASGQINVAIALDIIIQEENIPYVFLEAGTGKASLSFLRDTTSLERRKEVGLSFLRKGLLQGSEYLDLTSDLDFTLWGVEDPSLYDEALVSYRKIANSRDKHQNYLKKIQNTLNALKPKLLNEQLFKLESEYQGYLKGNVPLTEYLQTLTQKAKDKGINLKDFAHLETLRNLKQKEDHIDFKKANQEQRRAIDALSLDTQRQLQEASKSSHSAFKITLREPQEQKAYFALLEESLPSIDTYPHLAKYLQYLKDAQSLDAKEVLHEQKLLQREVFNALAVTPDEERLIQVQNITTVLGSLMKLQATPEDLNTYLKDKPKFHIVHLTGFLNRKIMDLETLYEKTLFLEEDFQSLIDETLTFYDLTTQRDKAFLNNMFNKMKEENLNKAILITGGYHTPNLKKLLKQQNTSYISITPQILHPTDHKRYEKLLLTQKLVSGQGNATAMMLKQVTFDERLQILRRHLEGRGSTLIPIGERVGRKPLVSPRVEQEDELEKKVRPIPIGPSGGRGSGEIDRSPLYAPIPDRPIAGSSVTAREGITDSDSLDGLITFPFDSQASGETPSPLATGQGAEASLEGPAPSVDRDDLLLDMVVGEDQQAEPFLDDSQAQLPDEPSDADQDPLNRLTILQPDTTADASLVTPGTLEDRDEPQRPARRPTPSDTSVDASIVSPDAQAGRSETLPRLENRDEIQRSAQRPTPSDTSAVASIASPDAQAGRGETLPFVQNPIRRPTKTFLIAGTRAPMFDVFESDASELNASSVLRDFAVQIETDDVDIIDVPADRITSLIDAAYEVSASAANDAVQDDDGDSNLVFRCTSCTFLIVVDIASGKVKKYAHSDNGNLTSLRQNLLNAIREFGGRRQEIQFILGGGTDIDPNSPIHQERADLVELSRQTGFAVTLAFPRFNAVNITGFFSPGENVLIVRETGVGDRRDSIDRNTKRPRYDLIDTDAQIQAFKREVDQLRARWLHQESIRYGEKRAIRLAETLLEIAKLVPRTDSYGLYVLREVFIRALREKLQDRDISNRAIQAINILTLENADQFSAREVSDIDNLLIYPDATEEELFYASLAIANIARLRDDIRGVLLRRTLDRLIAIKDRSFGEDFALGAAAIAFQTIIKRDTDRNLRDAGDVALFREAYEQATGTFGRTTVDSALATLTGEDRVKFDRQLTEKALRLPNLTAHINVYRSPEFQYPDVIQAIADYVSLSKKKNLILAETSDVISKDDPILAKIITTGSEPDHILITGGQCFDCVAKQVTQITKKLNEGPEGSVTYLSIPLNAVESHSSASADTLKFFLPQLFFPNPESETLESIAFSLPSTTRILKFSLPLQASKANRIVVVGDGEIKGDFFDGPTPPAIDQSRILVLNFISSSKHDAVFREEIRSQEPRDAVESGVRSTKPADVLAGASSLTADLAVASGLTESAPEVLILESGAAGTRRTLSRTFRARLLAFTLILLSVFPLATTATNAFAVETNQPNQPALVEATVINEELLVKAIPYEGKSVTFENAEESRINNLRDARQEAIAELLKKGRIARDKTLSLNLEGERLFRLLTEQQISDLQEVIPIEVLTADLKFDIEVDLGMFIGIKNSEKFRDKISKQTSLAAQFYESRFGGRNIRFIYDLEALAEYESDDEKFEAAEFVRELINTEQRGDFLFDRAVTPRQNERGTAVITSRLVRISPNGDFYISISRPQESAISNFIAAYGLAKAIAVKAQAGGLLKEDGRFDLVKNRAEFAQMLQVSGIVDYIVSKSSRKPKYKATPIDVADAVSGTSPTWFQRLALRHLRKLAEKAYGTYKYMLERLRRAL